jgi:hypothetical protein
MEAFERQDEERLSAPCVLSLLAPCSVGCEKLLPVGFCRPIGQVLTTVDRQDWLGKSFTVDRQDGVDRSGRTHLSVMFLDVHTKFEVGHEAFEIHLVVLGGSEVPLPPGCPDLDEPPVAEPQEEAVEGLAVVGVGATIAIPPAGCAMIDDVVVEDADDPLDVVYQLRFVVITEFQAGRRRRPIVEPYGHVAVFGQYSCVHYYLQLGLVLLC